MSGIKRRLWRLEDVAAAPSETEHEREERLKMILEGAEQCNDRHRRTIAKKRRVELINLKYRDWDFVRAGAPEDLSDEAMLTGDEDLPFTTTKSGSVFCTRDGRPVEEYRQVVGEDDWRRHMEWTALSLVRGDDPGFTLDEEDTFWTLDGRFALSPNRRDIGAVMGRNTQRILKSMPPDRWKRFLESDEDAANALERLFELVNGCVVPDNFAMSINNDWTQEEVDDFTSPLKPTALFLNTEERESTRRLTWALIHNPKARTILSKITRRRDAFISEGGGGR